MAAAKSTARKAASGELVETDILIDDLVPNPRNPNRHSEDQLGRLMASLRQRGQNRPVLARRANHMLIAGHGVTMAARRLGWERIRVALWDVSQQTADQAMLADNRLADLSERDVDRVAELLKEIPETDWLSVGFTGDEATKLMADLTHTELEVNEIAATEVFDTFWISVRGPMIDQADVLQQLKAVMAQFQDVRVELGTTMDA